MNNNKIYIYLKNIKLYNYSIKLNNLNIIYYYNYKSIIHSKNINIDLCDLKQILDSSNEDDYGDDYEEGDEDDYEDDYEEEYEDKDEDEYDYEYEEKEEQEQDIINDCDDDIEKIKTSIQLLRSKAKIILNNMTIKISNKISLYLTTCIIDSNNKIYNINISNVKVLYCIHKIVNIDKIKITYFVNKKHFIFDMDIIKCKLLSYEINIKECIDSILNYLNFSDEKSEYTYKIFIKNIHINFYNKNSLQLYIENVSFNSNINQLNMMSLCLKSCKKKILTLNNITYNNNNIDIDTIYINIYKTTFYKLRQSIDIFILKQKQKQTKTITLLNNMSTISDINYIDNLNYNNIVDNNVYKNIKDCSIDKVNINLNILQINCISNEKKVSIIFKSLHYTKYRKSMYNIQIKSIQIKDKLNKFYVNNKFNVNNKTDITFKDNFLNIIISPLIINFDYDIVKYIITIMESNMEDVKKLLYYDYIKYNYKEYFIHHLFIHTILLNVSYYPKKKNVFKSLFTNNKDYKLYNITNYKNIHITTKEIDIYYPLHTNNVLKKITKIWLQDIYTSQLKNIFRGIKYTKTLPITYDYSTKIITNVKTLLKSSIHFLDN